MRNNEIDVQALIKSLDTEDLILEATSLVAWEVDAVDNIDDVARYMWRGGPLPPMASAKPPKRIHLAEDDPRPEKKYWELVKKEMFEFLCEESPKYKELWSRVSKVEKQSTRALVAVISGYIGEKAGVEASILAGFVAVVLYGAAKISKEALCSYLKEKNA